MEIEKQDPSCLNPSTEMTSESTPQDKPKVSEARQLAKRRSNLRVRYGIELEHYDRLLRLQEGRCAICDVVKPNLYVDHSHDTNKVRGLLCSHCNTALGMVNENINTLVAMVNYLLYGYQHEQLEKI